MKKVLLTAFEAHAPRYTYSAQSVADTLHGTQEGKIHIYSRLIEETLFNSIEAVCLAMTDYKPDVIIMMGESTGQSLITLERIAHNFNEEKGDSIHDTTNEMNANNAKNTLTSMSGPVAYASQLPIQRMLNEMREKGVPVSISDSNGAVYGNHVFYGVLHYLAIHQLSIPSGWINLPMLPQKAALPEYIGQPSMSLHTCVEGVKFAIKASM
ncbi:hypothetical protein [uncultured Shewanella sp.]|uniref:pyroglutamyl-peptidase I family protein n=1 Tax=uncultured Shewanella sp. TaxID=173975 RepID=UPI0026084225|nr:hypothetical protein [uncultured Shewanella sp.]